jgi:hypothetical protein
VRGAALLVTVLASASLVGCAEKERATTPVDAFASTGAPVDALASTGAIARPPQLGSGVAGSGGGSSTVAANRSPGDLWARWPMPNAPLPGLPNPRRYDTRTKDVVVDHVTGLMWQRTLPNTFLTFQNAGRQCDQLTLAGHHDWRLPSRIELVSLIDTTRTQPAIDGNAFPGTPSDWFWTSSLAVDDPHAAWYVYFYFGYPKTDDMSGRFSVRCVRSDRLASATRPRYEVRAADVKDPGTGLRWQRAVSPKALSFDGARSYCARLEIAGKKRWRVPTLGELLTLIDERASSPMVDRVAFPETPGEPFWTSSTFGNGTQLAWHVRFDRGDGLYGQLTETFRVRCVQ